KLTPTSPPNAGELLCCLCCVLSFARLRAERQQFQFHLESLACQGMVTIDYHRSGLDFDHFHLAATARGNPHRREPLADAELECGGKPAAGNLLEQVVL